MAMLRMASPIPMPARSASRGSNIMKPRRDAAGPACSCFWPSCSGIPGMAEPDYRNDGYAHLQGFLPQQVCTAVLARLKVDLSRQGISLSSIEQEGPLLRSKAPELYGHHYPMFTSFLWGMTPAIERLTGESLLPTYAYFRLYRKGDICRVHGDRPSCEHSLSLTLGYSDGVAWPLEVS